MQYRLVVRRDGEDQRERFRIRQTESGPIVMVPLIGATWVSRDQRYWRRRIAVATVVFLASALAVTLSVLFTKAIARSGTLPATLFACCYALLAVAGLRSGHRWVKRAPALGGIAGQTIVGPLSVLLLVFMPVLAGMGVMVAPWLFRTHFPGEQRAAELTARLRAQSTPTYVTDRLGSAGVDR